MAQTTPRLLIYDAFRSLGVLRPGQGANDDAVDDALRLLNDLLEAWQLERLMVPGIETNAYTIPSGGPYTLGPGGTLGPVAPLRIEGAGYAHSDICGEMPLPILSAEDFRRHLHGLYSDGASPLTTLYINPSPQAGVSLTLWTWAPLTQFASADSPVQLPPAYARALRWNLAMEMAASAVVQAKIPNILYARVEQQANESKAAIKSFHSSPAPTMDATDGGALRCGCGSGYDICSDTWGN